MGKNSVFITGHTGFVGINLLKYFDNIFKINKYIRNDNININSDVVINLVGKAHDLKNTLNTNEYYEVNTNFSNKLFDLFINSNASIFITLSSIKAVSDYSDDILTEEIFSCPITHYGKSKLLAEQYILSKEIPHNKRVFILRPSMIHGPGNKGNLNLLFNIIKMRIPWPLGAFDNKRSFLSIENLCFIIKELIENEDIKSGIYNVCDDEPLSTNEVINIISNTLNINTVILKIPKILILFLCKIGDFLKLPLNSERLFKLTNNFIVSNTKIKNAINKPLPISSRNGLINTFNSF
jgi:nucleoside-diphosphate-sugar epimerase